MRAFLAVPADPAWVESAARLSAVLSASLPQASWTRREAWHLTLKFFGEIAPPAAERFAAQVGPVVEASRAGELLPGGAVVFPPRGRARVLTVGFAPSPSLASLEALARSVESASRRMGAAPEERAFHPHVTLARIRHPWPAEAVERFRETVGAWNLPPWKFSECVFYESRLGPAGAVHTPLRAFAFAGSVEEVRS